MIDNAQEALLWFHPSALLRCFAVADILADCYDEPWAEYGLLGLARKSRPLHMISTPLLAGQVVTSSSVEQSGHEVLGMGKELDLLSRRIGERLVPMVFIHRHPGSCDASKIDDEFLQGVFLDQVYTAVAFPAEKPSSLPNRCSHCQEPDRLVEDSKEVVSRAGQRPVEYGLCFGLIVNRKREYRIYAARRDHCLGCGSSVSRNVPAALRVRPQSMPSEAQQKIMRSSLEIEIEAKIKFQDHVGTGQECQ